MTRRINFPSITGFTLFVAAFCMANILLNIINHRFFLSDFKVYYLASGALVSGDPVYLHAFGLGSGFYKYSPVILYLFLPSAMLPFPVAAVIHFIVLSFACWYSFILIREILTGYFFPGPIRREGLLLGLSFCCVMIHLVRELYLGNINILLLVLCLLALRSFLRGRYYEGSVMFGIVLLAKPFFLILILPLLFRKIYRSLAGLTAVILAGLAVPFLADPRHAMYLYSGWARTMVLHDTGFPGKNSIGYIISFYFRTGLPAFAGYIIIAAAGLLAILLIMKNRSAESGRNGSYGSARDLAYEWFFLLALIPCLVKTDSEHFLATAPLLAFVIYYIGVGKRYWPVPFLIILLFFFGANSMDLLGRSLSDRFFNMGLLGVSNLLIILLSYVVFRMRDA
jgi:hypothetical protein